MDVLKISGLCKSFGDKVIHNQVSFSLKKGECLGLIGGSGTGKSVLLRSLIGLEKPDQGEIFFHSQRLSDLEENQWFTYRLKIAYAFQGGALFDSMTVFENLAYPLKEHTDLNPQEIDQKIRKTLSRFGLLDSITNFPGSLSGGMQKRLGLARAIILEPEVILYDEPTAGLDPKNTRIIEETILKLKTSQSASILVTHDMPVAFKVCDRVALLRNQKIEFICDLKNPNDTNLQLLKDFSTGSY
jgi:phospholipid/cholesterol/gamma-HCH transport system ATP-binding protein